MVRNWIPAGLSLFLAVACTAAGGSAPPGLSSDGKTEVARVTADERGNYRTALPPGEYVLDVQGRAPGRVRAQPRRFQVVSGKTVRIDMDMDTGVR